MDPEENKWLLIFCDEDTSYSVVKMQDVVCDSSVKVGDTVKFYYKHRFYHGLVKNMSDDHARLVKDQDELNKKKPKREDSFKVDRPRKAALQFKTGVKPYKRAAPSSRTSKVAATAAVSTSQIRKDSACQSKEKSSQKEKPATTTALVSETPKKPPSDSTNQSSEKPLRNRKHERTDVQAKKTFSPLQILVNDVMSSDPEDDDSVNTNGKQEAEVLNEHKDSDSPVDDKNDSSSSDDDLTPEQMKLIIKESKRRQNADYKDLVTLARIKVPPTVSQNVKTVSKKHGDIEATEPNNVTSNLKPSKEGSFEEMNVSVPSSSNATNQSMPLPETKTVKVFNKRKRVKYEKKVFEGESFRFKATDPGVVEIYKDVYADSQILKKVKINSKESPQALTRNLLKSVYTKEALEECSLTGRPSSGKGRELAKTRPPLDPLGITAIFDYVYCRCEKKNWPKPEPSALRRAISSVLCEDRYYERLLEAQTVESD